MPDIRQGTPPLPDAPRLTRVAPVETPITRAQALTGSAWLLVNGGGGAVGAPRLGGSQSGLRLYWQPTSFPVALTGRVSRAIERPRETEASVGLALRHAGFGLLAERRQRLDRRGGAFAVTAFGGVYDQSLPVGFRLDGFAQAGWVGLRQRRGFLEGQVRAERAVLGPRREGLSVGGGAWGAAQDGVTRVEAGPLVAWRLPVAGASLRLAGEYRVRIAGNATPASGPSLTLGVDF